MIWVLIGLHCTSAALHWMACQKLAYFYLCFCILSPVCGSDFFHCMWTPASPTPWLINQPGFPVQQIGFTSTLPGEKRSQVALLTGEKAARADFRKEDVLLPILLEIDNANRLVSWLVTRPSDYPLPHIPCLMIYQQKWGLQIDLQLVCTSYKNSQQLLSSKHQECFCFI